jgi:hypothetical protein
MGADEIANAKIHASKQEWIHEFSKHLNYKIASQHQLSRVRAEPNWVFGISILNIPKSFCYHNE